MMQSSLIKISCYTRPWFWTWRQLAARHRIFTSCLPPHFCLSTSETAQKVLYCTLATTGIVHYCRSVESLWYFQNCIFIPSKMLHIHTHTHIHKRCLCVRNLKVTETLLSQHSSSLTALHNRHVPVCYKYTNVLISRTIYPLSNFQGYTCEYVRGGEKIFLLP